MEAHSLELLHAALWLIGIIGAALVGIVMWLARSLFTRLDRHEDTMFGIRSLLQSEIKALREMQHDIEVRVTRLETACDIMQASNHSRGG